MNYFAGRLIGKKGIMPVFEKMYGIRTWRGAVKFILRNHLPLRRTPSGKPFFFEHELISYDQKFQAALREIERR